MPDKCDHVERVSIHPSIKIGGAAMGRCERDALPGMVVCGEHATRDALVMNIRTLSAKVEKLEAEVERLRKDGRGNIKLGWKVKDRLTGFTGIVEGRTEWFTGCAQCGVRAYGLDDGKPIKLQWFDESRLEILDKSQLDWVVSQSSGETTKENPGRDIEREGRNSW